MRESEDIIYYEDQEHINKVIEVLKKYSYDELSKRDYFEFSLMEKNTDEELLKKYYPQFERVKIVGLRKRKGKKSSYDIYYELDDGSAILFAVDISKDPPMLINAFKFYKNLKKFMRYIKKKYGRQMV